MISLARHTRRIKEHTKKYLVSRPHDQMIMMYKHVHLLYIGLRLVTDNNLLESSRQEFGLCISGLT